MKRAPSGETKLTLWQIVEFFGLFLIILVQMKKSMPESSFEFEQLTNDSNISDYGIDTRRYNAAIAVKEKLVDPESFHEMAYKEYIAKSANQNMYYQTSILYLAKNSSGSFTVQSVCCQLTKEGVVIEIFPCDIK